MIDDAHECTRDCDEQRILDRVVTGERQVSMPDPVLVRMLVEAPAHGASAQIFALAGKPVAETLHIGEATVVPASHGFPQLGLVNGQKLIPDPDQTVEQPEVACAYTPTTCTDQLFLGAVLKLASTERMILRSYYAAVWHVDVQCIELEPLEFVDSQNNSSEPDREEEEM